MEEQQFLLRWHFHETTLLRNLPQLLDSEILTDITLSADNQIVRAHKIVLATCSSYFLQLFQSVGTVQHPIIILHNTNYDDLRCLISFIYRGQCLIAKRQLPGLLSLAKLLQIQGLCDMRLPQSQENAEPRRVLIDTRYTEVPKNENCFRIQEDRIPKQVTSELLDFSQKTNDHLDIKENEQQVNITTENKLLLESTPSSSRKPRDLLYKCFVCGKYLSNQYNLRVHMETHKEGYYVCHACPHVSRSRDALRKHISYRHQEQYSIKKRKKNDDI